VHSRLGPLPCDALGGEIIRATDEKNDFRMGDNFYIGVLYENEGVALDESGFSKVGINRRSGY
jgi:hypothetical protein